MSKLKEIITYIIKNYPRKTDLSNARLTKIIYLSDWHQAINEGHQISSIGWYFDNYGPYVNDVQAEAESYPELFKIEDSFNMFGSPKKIFRLKNESYQPCLNDEETNSIDHVIKQTTHLNWQEFIKLVYSTYPIMSSEKYTHLDLIEKAQEYNLI